MTDRHALGRLADIPDQRDYAFKVARRTKTPLPSKLDLRSTDYGIQDQGQLGSCVGHGTTGAYRNLLRHLGKPDWDGSRLATYYYARLLEGTVKVDAGAQIRDGMKVIQQRGALDETLWPYVIAKFAQAPSVKASNSGKKHEALTYQSVDNTDWDAIRAALVANGNLAIGISVYASFESDAVASTGKVPMPKAKESLLGGHCMRAVGFTATTLIVANSWSADWGDKGYLYLPKAYCTNPQLASDWWTFTA